MSTPDKVDFFVIGAGSGGVRSARIAAGYGAKVVVAEDHRVGGTCVVRGCVPKKLYVYASRFADDFADAAGFGWTVGATRFDWPDLVAAKEKEITRLSGLYRTNLEKAGASLVERPGAARRSEPRAWLTDGANSRRTTSWSRRAAGPPCIRRSRAWSSPSRRMRSSISRSFRSA